MKEASFWLLLLGLGFLGFFAGFFIKNFVKKDSVGYILGLIGFAFVCIAAILVKM